MKANKQTNVTNEEMESNWIVRFNDMKERGIPLMFIDSIIPGHQRVNYAVVGDTASENPEYNPIITEPHGFQIGMVKAPPGNGPAYHTHDYIEAFLPLTGDWRFYWGNSPDEIEGETVIGPWDLISLPPNLYRGFENISDEDAWCFAVLEQHEAFDGRDPYWSPQVIKKAAEHGFNADEKGKMIPPENFKELEKQMGEKLRMGNR
ncbi:cupin domain-containing protein [Halobacillus naozhouensis]|uniref:Cupin domain-containing protein n=1 Tax=Halobacillus naozhouensis TaxID=554880 RepID=A0ABY8IZR5_9BACI|nr:cupin domain-containing protein [Halobacillus naozhouensis]WFT75565.1 cupin domain-containing protein [Halobacillus naozhouensis]